MTLKPKNTIMPRHTELTLDARKYRISVLKRVQAAPQAARLVVVACQPNELAEGIAKACVESIRRFTPEPHELWVVDNCSPARHRGWLERAGDLNVICNDTPPLPPSTARGLRGLFRRPRRQENGSYANGIALEIAARVIDPATERLMTLHMDTMACRSGWLSYLLAELDEKVRVAGVRRDTARGEVIHCLGMVFDFTLFRPLALTFLPELPKHDVGDKISLRLREAGYELRACRNTHTDPSLADMIPEGSPFRHVPVDRAFDDDGHVIFAHLGRGVVKSEDDTSHPGKFSARDWLAFAEAYLGKRLYE